MADDVGRAVGAGSGMAPVTIAGKECRIRPLTLLQLTELERICLDHYCRQYLRVYANNIDLVPEHLRAAMMERKMEECARWDVGDLPPKYVYDARGLDRNPGIDDVLRTLGHEPDSITDKQYRRLVSSALDRGALTPALYEELVGKAPIRAEVGYANWWITGSMDGMLEMISMCFQQDGVTKQQVVEAISLNPGLIVDLAREIELSSVPKPGNG